MSFNTRGQAHNTNTKGFGLVEMLVVVAVIAILAVLSYQTFFDTNRMQALEKDRDIVLSALERARSLTLSSSGDRQYGVHIENNRVILFPGNNYDVSDPENAVESLNALVTIASSSIKGGGNDIVFERLTGKTLQSGTIGVSLIADPSREYIIVVHDTGLVETE